MAAIFSSAETWFQMELTNYNSHNADNTKNRDSDQNIVCECKVESSENLIDNTQGWSCAVTGWSISSTESLYYQPKDESVYITYGAGEVAKYDGNANPKVQSKHEKYETRTQTRRSHNFVDLMKLFQPNDPMQLQ